MIFIYSAKSLSVVPRFGHNIIVPTFFQISKHAAKSSSRIAFNSFFVMFPSIQHGVQGATSWVLGIAWSYIGSSFWRNDHKLRVQYVMVHYRDVNNCFSTIRVFLTHRITQRSYNILIVFSSVLECLDSPLARYWPNLFAVSGSWSNVSFCLENRKV